LFSRDGNSACTEFDEYDESQQGYCKEGEACLWYSWQKSRSSQAYVRECFSKSIVLGTVDDPLVAKPYCDPLDISENSISRVTACLCETDLCNAFRSGSEKPPSRVNQQSSEPKRNDKPSSKSNRRQPEKESQSQRNSERESNSLRTNDQDSNNNRISNQNSNSLRNSDQRSDSQRNSNQRSDSQRNSNRGSNSQRNREIEETPRSPKVSQRAPAKQTYHPDKAGLQCFSCGSLLNPDAKCDEFSRTNISMTNTCLKDESCLMYTWKKSSTETATLRECFPTRVLLGTINNPLTPSEHCFERDITDDGSGSIKACLCSTDYCNDAGDVYDENEIFSGNDNSNRKTVSSPSRNQKTTTRTPRQTTRQTTRQTIRQTFPPTTRRAITQRTTTARPRSCPSDFENVSNNCYFISSERVGWIEAKKKCEMKEARLISLEDEDKQEVLLGFVSSITNRRRGKYWTGGNDIQKEGRWEWEGTSGSGKEGTRFVPDFGWSEEPYNSAEENCLSWSVSFGYNVGDSDSNWHGASCCNSQRYICQL